MPQTQMTPNLPVAASSPVVLGGIDTHKDLHVAAVIDTQERVLGTRSFSTTRAGYRALVRWLRSFGDVRRVGVEGTGSYGAGITRHLVEPGSRSSKSTDPTARNGGARARTTIWTRSAPRAPRCTIAAPAPRRAKTARWSPRG
jgi:transposase